MRIRSALVLLTALLLGCGDLTSSAGEFGRVQYSLHSDYLVEASSLLDVSVLTGHPQRIGVSLTDAGDQATDDESDMTHTVSPSDGVTLDVLDAGDQGVPDVQITVTTPGEYVLESLINGDLFDRITLTFDAPASLELITWVRAPDSSDFAKREGASIDVDEGAQAAFVPVPLDAAGDRLAGDLVTAISGTPDEAVVAGFNVLGIYEQRVVQNASPPTVYFIEPGTITVTLTDEPNGVSAAQTFEVAPVQPAGS